MQRSMARSNVKLMPFSAADKPRVIRPASCRGAFILRRPSQRQLHRAAVDWHNIPSWFVLDHGDKVQRSALQRMELFTKPWPVNLSIWCPSLTMTQVKFAGGWQAFATSNGFLEGDVLIFVLTAMSEFKVYLFLGIEFQNPPPKRRRSTSSTGRSQKKAKWRNYERRDEQMGAEEERGDKSAHGLNRESIAVYDFAMAPILPPVSMQHLLSFWKTRTAINVCPNAGAALEFRKAFWGTYGSRIDSVVKLQAGILDQSPVRTMTCCELTRYYLRAEWRAFVTENHLHEGQQILCTLSADSSFVVQEQKSVIAPV